MPILSHNIKWLRKHHGISKKRMAQIMGIGIGSLNQLERGSVPQRLTVTVLFAIEDHFGIAPPELLGKRLLHLCVLTPTDIS